MRHCPRCGGVLAQVPPTICGTCGYEVYFNPRPSGGAIVLRAYEGYAGDEGDKHGEEFLVIRRVRGPRAGWWDLPSGFCEGFEHPADAAVREAREELGVEIELGDLVGMYIGTYEFQDEVLPVLDCYWLATLGTGEITLDSAEASEYAWMRLDAPPPLAFATMDSAVRDAQIRRSSVRLFL